MTEKEAVEIAKPIVKQVVDALSKRRYEDICHYAKLYQISLQTLQEMIEEYLTLNELPYIDAFDVDCNLYPNYDYQQLDCVVYNDGSGFTLDYALTTDSNFNDLTLQMEFIWTEEDIIEARILDVHVL